MYVCPDNFCDRLNLVWWCTIMGQSIRWKYHFAIFKVKAIIISTRSSKIDIFTTQNSLIIHYHKMGLEDIMKRFYCFYSGRETGCGLADYGPDCCHSWPSWYLKQGSIPVPVKKMWKEHHFCDEYTCLLNLLVNGLSVWYNLLCL